MQQEGAKARVRFPCLLLSRRAWSLNGARVGAGPGVGLEGWLRWFAHLFVVVCAGGICSTLILLLMPFFVCLFACFGSSEVAIGSFVCIFWSRMCTNCARMWLFLVLRALYFVAQGEVCPGAGTVAKGPRSQLVSVSL